MLAHGRRNLAWILLCFTLAPGLGWPLSSGFPEEHDAVRYSWSNSKHREHTHPRDPRWSDHSSRLDPTDLMPQASGGIGS